MPRRSASPGSAAERTAMRRQPDRATQPIFSDETAADAPLAARMRPRTLDAFVGQPHLVGDQGALTRVVRPGYLPSMVLWGPPGTGKTTLARLLAERSGGTWRQISAVTSGVADIRQLVADARQLREAGGKTVVFIDELHRFNKAQQDALLPHVEDGTITLVGATTENPYYEINSPLLSRLRVYRLEPLSEENLREIVTRALADERGLSGRVSLTDEGFSALLDLSGGDARQALNIVESAAAVTDASGTIGPELVAEAAQQRLLEYDRVGDQHYEAASAYVASAPKSNRAGGAYFSALADVEEKGRLPVPLHLRPAAHRRLTREHGYGKGYLYPHDFEEADVNQQYLPDALVGTVYYEPSEEGLEKQIGDRLERLRRKRREAEIGSGIPEDQ